MSNNPFWFRDTSSKLLRRFKKLIGRPDPSPWVVRPPAREPAQASVDLLLVLDASRPAGALSELFQQAAAGRGLSFLTADQTQLAQLGAAFKPLVCLNLSGKPVQIAAAITLADRESQSAPYRGPTLRAFNILGARSLLWYAPDQKRHTLLTWADLRQHDLLPALDLLQSDDDQSAFFSAEVAINAPGKFTLLSQGGVDFASLPLEWNTWLASRVAQFAWRIKLGVPASDGHEMWLPNAQDAANSVITSAA